jgi:hypothetical protein
MKVAACPGTDGGLMLAGGPSGTSRRARASTNLQQHQDSHHATMANDVSTVIKASEEDTWGMTMRAIHHLWPNQAVPPRHMRAHQLVAPPVTRETAQAAGRGQAVPPVT